MASTVLRRPDSIYSPTRYDVLTHTVNNFAGLVYLPQMEETLRKQLRIGENETVLDLGITSDYSNGNEFYPLPLTFHPALPFRDKEFDVILCRTGLERAADPESLCKEMMRIAKRGFIETVSPTGAYFGSEPSLRWLVSVEKKIGEADSLLFNRRPYIRVPFRYALRGSMQANPDLRRRWEVSFRNVVYTQFVWETGFNIVVLQKHDDFDYDDPAQAAESHLDSLYHGLITNGVPLQPLLNDAEIALRLQPEWAVTHNAYGCLLWGLGRYPEAQREFSTAHSLEEGNVTYARNMRMRQGSSITPALTPLPPTADELSDISHNFAGKVYYAFVSYDERLAQDIGISPGDKVLDVGGGQRPLLRADVSVDIDIDEGVHRQGLAIQRDRPLVCGNVQELPFQDKSFDVACCRMVLEHVSDPEAALSELQRVAKRGFFETPNTLWECFYGHPTHRWLIEFEADTRTVVFRRKPFHEIPFRSAIVPFLYTNAAIRRAFEITFRNLTTVQVCWDEENPVQVRVENDPDCPYDYLNCPSDALRGELSYAQDMFEMGLLEVAAAESCGAAASARTCDEKTKVRRLQSAIEERALFNSFPPDRPLFRPASHSLLPPPFVWNAPLWDPTGYAEEARNFLAAMEDAGILPIARDIRWNRRDAQLSLSQVDSLQQMVQRPEPNRPFIDIQHILGGQLKRNPRASACVGRTMFETDRLPEGWAEACNRMDAIWVPSEFNRETFGNAGIEPAKLRIVPGCIHLTEYNPSTSPLHLSGMRDYNFLAIFDWTLRKGWDILIRSFVEEFRSEEDVALILQVHSSLGYTTEQIYSQVSGFLTETLHANLDKIPDILIQTESIPAPKMPALFAAADCYVLPSHGEGWGRPYMEAMAMELPVISTDWSGMTEFITPDTGYLIDCEIVEVPETAWKETPTFRGHRWAEPSSSHLRSLMRRAFEEREESKEMGKRGRADIESGFSSSAVAEIIIQELKRLV